MGLASLVSLFHKWGFGDLEKESFFALANVTKLEAKLILIVFIVFCLFDTKVIHVNDKYFDMFRNT